MLLLLLGLFIIMTGVGLACYLLDVLIGEQRTTNGHLTAMREKPKDFLPPIDRRRT
jgi:hypothetical protein